MQYDKVISNLVGVYGDERARCAVVTHELRRRVRQLTKEVEEAGDEIDRLRSAAANSKSVESMKTEECDRLRIRNHALIEEVEKTKESRIKALYDSTPLDAICSLYEFMPKNTEHEKVLAEDLRVLLSRYGRNYE